MSTAIIVATREIRERSRLFIVAVAVAILPFAIALVPAVRGNRPHVIMLLGAGMAFNYACAVAVAMGVSTIGRDLTEKRLSFYFSKPISPLALWTGKAGASLLVAVACALIVAVPSYLAAHDAWRTAWITGGGRFAAAVPLLLLLFFFGSHVLGTVTRSRSILLALDFVLAVGTVVTIASILRPILLAGGGSVSLMLAAALGAAFLTILAVAPVWQLAKGRTDIRRSHLELSKFLWSAVAIVLLAAFAFLFWLRGVSASELVEVRDVQQSPAGGWAFVTGLGAHRGDFHSTFLMNAKTGRTMRLAGPPWSGVRWSRDGRVASWMQPVAVWPQQGICELYVQSVDEAESVATGIQARIYGRFILSDDGSRAAVANGGVIAVHDLRTHRVLAAASGFDDYRPLIFFVTNDVLRVIDYPSISHKNIATVRVSDLDVRTRKLTRYGHREIATQPGPISVSQDGSRMFLRISGEIVDGRTLATIVKIVPSANWGSMMLNDGSVVVVDRTNGVRLRFFDRDGAARGELALPNLRIAAVSGETTGGKLLVSGTGASPEERSMLVVDRARLVIERTEPNVKGPTPQWYVDPRTPRYEANQPFAGIDKTGKLKIWSGA
jgi:hypothetical protein